jgi:hypothetical protein
MWHDTVEALYNCLSYVWGSDKHQQEILINKRKLYVRNNLWKFLQVARTEYAASLRTFWIDALSIHQDSISERNHQVARMLDIFQRSRGIRLARA